MRPIAALVLLTLAGLPLPASAWNSPAHMLSAAITYQVLRREEPQDYRKGKSSVGEASLICEPLAGEASRRSRC
jgi:hypothetical protein